MNTSPAKPSNNALSSVVAHSRLRALLPQRRSPSRGGAGLYLRVFNFDGVLADSLHLYRQSLVVAARVAGLPMTAVRPELLVGANSLQGEQLAADLDIPRPRRGAFVRQFEAKRLGSAWRCDLYQGAAQMLATSCTRGYTAILSRSDQGFIESVLCHHNLGHKVHAVVSGDLNNRGERLIEGLLRRFNVPPERAIYCGDSVRDIQLATRAGLRSAACTWGWQSELVARVDSTFTASRVGQLLAQLESPASLSPDVSC